MSQSIVNYPRLRVTVNGVVLEGVSKVSITQANAYQIASFCFLKGFVPNDAFPASWWATTANKTMLVAIALSIDGINFIPYVFGNTLYFNPPGDNPSVYPVELTRDSDGLLVANITGLMLERHMTYARDVVVKVKSWNSRTKTTITSTVRTKTKDESTDLKLKPSNYLYEVPNLSQAQCLAMAEQLALDISQHERYAKVTIPSLALMNPQTLISVSGTGTDYDITYFPLTVDYDLATESGGTTTVEAKSSSPLAAYDDDTGQQLGTAP